MSDLAAALDEAAAASGGTRIERGNGVDYEVNGRVVASVGPGGAEFHLGSDVAPAATGTPDTQASPRGPGWVLFRPRVLDRFALDRIAAWLGLAVRLGLRG
ncbi:MAG: hypothetical protein ACRDF7_02615 [Candidatus Limnocylindrales bacterium]